MSERLEMTGYSVYDKVSQNYGVPMWYVNDGCACREFVRFLGTQDARFRSDFELYKVASFGIEDAITSTYDKPVLVMKGGDYVDAE